MTTIKLKDTIGKKIGMRSSAVSLFAEINDDTILDFEGVIFTSRTFMQELIYQINTSNYNINVCNLNHPFVESMFNVVLADYEEYLSGLNEDVYVIEDDKDEMPEL